MSRKPRKKQKRTIFKEHIREGEEDFHCDKPI